MPDSHDEAAAESDAGLLERARANDLAAYGELYARHHEAGLRVARAVTGDPSLADDLVSTAFERIHAALLRGHGPEDSFRAYLYTVIRRLAIEHAERQAREDDVDDWTPYEGGLVAATDDSTESKLVTAAFASLSERHQAVLWYLDVEGMSPARAAPMLGLSSNAVSALAIRARDALRDAYLQAHVSDSPRRAECAPTRRLLGAYVGDRISARARDAVEAHLAECDECPIVLAELREERGRLRAILWPIAIGAAAASQLVWLGVPQAAHAAEAGGAGGASGGGTGTTGARSLASTTRQAVRSPGLWVAAAATAALLIVGSSAVIVAAQSGPSALGGAAQADSSGAPVVPGGPHAAAGSSDSAVPGGTPAAPAPGDGSVSDPVVVGTVPGTPSTGAASGRPASAPSAVPSGAPSSVPSSGPTTAPGSGSGAASPPPAPPPAPPPVAQAPSIAVSLDVLGDDLLAGEVGEVDVTTTGLGPLSVNGTLKVALPSGVQYRGGGLVGGLLGLITGILTTGGIQSCSADSGSTNVVCQIVSLVPGATATVRIPVTIAHGAEDSVPLVSLLLG